MVGLALKDDKASLFQYITAKAWLAALEGWNSYQKLCKPDNAVCRASLL
jgi:hypothetical protein